MIPQVLTRAVLVHGAERLTFAEGGAPSGEILIDDTTTELTLSRELFPPTADAPDAGEGIADAGAGDADADIDGRSTRVTWRTAARSTAMPMPLPTRLTRTRPRTAASTSTSETSDPSIEAPLLNSGDDDDDGRRGARDD